MKGKNKVYAVIDTNVVVSSFFSRNGQSNPALIIEKIFDNIIVPIYNDEILAEYKEVLSRPVFPFSPERINDVIATFKEFGISAERTPVSDETFPDPDDIVFYEIKMSVEDSYLVTGNLKHFPQKPFVVTPARMIEILEELNI
ncbi:MAG: putative toxin-antitoxin system toxin component, PIN family [Barnesiella sp.]|nr:putative toxin-antitoxin system toxin component, PIN family [Barnesiella sp.]